MRKDAIVDFNIGYSGEELLVRECRHCGDIKPINEFKAFKTVKHKNTKSSMCKECCKKKARDWYRRNKEKARGNIYEYAEFKKYLRYEWGSRRSIDLVKKFNMRCAFSNEHTRDCDLTDDHFIALKTGHGGTYDGNILPVDLSLNISKGVKNPFEWVKERDDLDITYFDDAVKYLADKNGLTIDEYRQFVYWCYENVRTIDEVIADRRTSVEIWKESR